MPDALAFFENDMAPREPRPQKQKRAKKRAEQPPTPEKKPMFRFRLRPRIALFLAFIGLVGVGVPLNALYLQEGRHPAPLFKSTVTLPKQIAAVPPPPAHRPAPPPPAEPAKAETIKTAAAKPARIETENAARPEKTQRDEIGMLIDGGGSKAEGPDKTVLFAQRALMKLGYVLRPDGVFGGSTRQALEKFERDSGLPVKGELTTKILRQLAARSGLPRE